MNQALMIKVGANIKDNKGLSPIFNDDTYEYIPSLLEPDFNTSKHHNHRHYSNMLCQNKNLQDMHMSSFVNEGTGHVDPEFYTFTYGETRKPYINLLKKLRDGDLLVFLITLQKYLLKQDNFILTGNPQLFVFGFFTIQDWQKNLCEFDGDLSNFNLNNFEKTCNEHIIYSSKHIKTPDNKKLFLIQGQKNNSVLFKHPLKISQEEKILNKYVKNWGIEQVNKSLQAHWCKNFETVKSELFKHGQENRWVEWAIP
ncbi:hypothetical protein [Spirobacillus cienkowskii]|jgi:hypothetical protein|uniref:Nucleotide modification associated domain-containing protein n=1 Tax=Spirobacillus cienkowskii TaxID=495820 RepID=A0A369KRZ0_9BACT|nr:MAG: hypothetical protein DCC88_09340 [Spirobacillus cienkowskii]